MSDAFRIDDNVMRFTMLTVVNDIVDDILLVIIVFLRQQNILRAIGNTTPECDITGVSTHNLNDTATLVRRGSISYLIDRFHCCVDRCIKSDRIIRTCNIQIDRSRQTDRIDALFGKSLRTAVRTVTTDHDNTVNSMLAADLSTLLLSFRSPELRTSGCSKYCSTPLDRIGYVLFLHIYNLFI